MGEFKKKKFDDEGSNVRPAKWPFPSDQQAAYYSSKAFDEAAQALVERKHRDRRARADQQRRGAAERKRAHDKSCVCATGVASSNGKGGADCASLVESTGQPYCHVEKGACYDAAPTRFSVMQASRSLCRRPADVTAR